MSISIGELADEGVLSFSDGYRTKRPEHGRPGFRILRVADIEDGTVSPRGDDYVADTWAGQIGTKLSQPGDVLLTTKGTVGRVAIMPPLNEQVVYSPQLCYFRVHDVGRLNARWLSYWFKSADFLAQASHRANNTDMAAYINLADIRSLKLPDRAISEQRAIAEVLGALDDKIAANSSKESIAASLIEAMYQRAVLAPGTASVPLMQALTVAFGEPFGGAQFVPQGDGRPLIRIRDLKTFRSQVWTTESRPKEVLVQPGDVVVGMDAEFRPTWWLGEPGLLNQRVCRVTSREAGPAFVREALRSPMGRIEGYKTGTTVIHLNKSDLLRENVLWPVAEVRTEFDRGAGPVLRTLVASAQERQRLGAMRDALLPQLMSGRIRVEDAERVVEGVV